jgi:DNA-directed RNA polymerase specialized sigma24 family protein
MIGGDSPVQKRQPWSLTPEAFAALLSSLDPDPESAGEKYERIRGGLVRFFEWRGAPWPEEHADDTLNRVARKLAEGHHVDDPFTYVYGVARLVLIESFKRRDRERAALAEAPATSEPDPGESGRRFDCLDRCLEELPGDGKELLTEYYQGEKSARIDARARLADRLGIAPNALRLRASRLRQRLEACVDACMNRGAVPA